jgi:hypothetical protein
MIGRGSVEIHDRTDSGHTDRDSRSHSARRIEIDVMAVRGPAESHYVDLDKSRDWLPRNS